MSVHIPDAKWHLHPEVVCHINFLLTVALTGKSRNPTGTGRTGPRLASLSTVQASVAGNLSDVT